MWGKLWLQLLPSTTLWQSSFLFWKIGIYAISKNDDLVRVTLWLTEVAVYTFELIFPGENKSVEFLVIFIKFIRIPYRVCHDVIWNVTDGLFVMISPAESCVPFLSACIHDFAPFKPRINHILFNCCIHIKIEPARFNKMGKFHCCVIEWSNIVLWW